MSIQSTELLLSAPLLVRPLLSPSRQLGWFVVLSIFILLVLKPRLPGSACPVFTALGVAQPDFSHRLGRHSSFSFPLSAGILVECLTTLSPRSFHLSTHRLRDPVVHCYRTEKNQEGILKGRGRWSGTGEVGSHFPVVWCCVMKPHK